MPEPQMIRPGVWKLRVYVGDNRIRSKTYEAASEQAARRKAPRIITAIEDEYAVEAVKIAERSRYRDTVAGLLDDWQAEQLSLDRSPTYIERNELICRRIRDALGDIPISELTPADCNAFYRDLRTLPGRAGKGRMSEATVMRHHRILDAALRMAEAEDRIIAAPTRRARVPKPLPVDNDLPPDRRMVALIEALPHHLAVCIELDAQTGLRRGELVGLRWGDVDLEAGLVTVRNNTLRVRGVQHDRRPKGKRIRSIPLTSATVALLRSWHIEIAAAVPEMTDDVRLFPDFDADTSGRTPRKPDWLTKAWARHCKKHGATVRLHDLRHWYATKLLDRGVPLGDVAAVLGHAQMSTTANIYGHARRDHDRIRAALD